MNMDKNKNQNLAKEITDFCKQRSKQPLGKTKTSKSLIQSILTSFIALAIAGGVAEPNHGSWWAADY
jgi:hypothetical protein